MCTYLFTYLGTYIHIHEKIEVEMLLYTLIKKFIEVQENILNAFGIILFLQNGVVV
jgi:hypothetical protein